MVKDILIKDECGVIAHLQELALMDYSREHCAIAMADRIEEEYHIRSYCMVEDVGGSTNNQFSVIPRKVSYALLKLCNREKAIPIILHTHLLGYEYSRPLGFSPQDTKFADKFINRARQMENIPACGFAVMNGEDFVISVQDFETETYDTKEVKKMGLLKPGQYMITYNEEHGIIYATDKGRLKTTTPEHAKAIKECMEQYFDGKLTDADREKLEYYIENSFKEFQDLPIGTVPDVLNREILRRIELLVVNECNLNCKYCYAHGGDYGMQAQRMLPDEAEKYLRELLVGKYRYVEIVTFFGGEPTLCPDTIKQVCEFFEACTQNGTFEKMPMFLMVSNGTLIDGKLAEIIHRFNIGVTISVDGPEEINDLLRVDRLGNGSFAKISRGIENMMNAGTSPILLEATYTTRHKEMGYSKEAIRKYLIDYFHVQNVMVADCTSGGSDNNLPYTDWDIHAGENGEMLLEEVRYASICLRRKEIFPIGCDAGFDSVLLMPNGDIYPCHSFVGHSDYKIACFREGHFDFLTYQGVLAKLVSVDKFHNARCAACWAKAVCLSCPAQMLLEKDRECIDASCYTRRGAQEYALLKCAEDALRRKEVK